MLTTELNNGLNNSINVHCAVMSIDVTSMSCLTVLDVEVQDATQQNDTGSRDVPNGFFKFGSVLVRI